MPKNMAAVFMIINRSDPIYEAEFSSPSSSAPSSSSGSHFLSS